MAEAFTLKGNAYTVTTLHIASSNITALDLALKKKVASAPKFFNATPVVLDLYRLAESPETLELDAVLNTVRKHAFIPIAIRSPHPEHQTQAYALGLACFMNDSKESKATAKDIKEIEETAVAVPAKVEKIASSPSKLITQPVRSGQQIYARGGDLIILSSVSPGAEVLADGHIHVYGTLRGRALAGVLGDTSAHIFCQTFEPELVSIAGQYLISEQLKNSRWGEASKIYLADEHLQITAF